MKILCPAGAAVVPAAQGHAVSTNGWIWAGGCLPLALSVRLSEMV